MREIIAAVGAKPKRISPLRAKEGLDVLVIGLALSELLVERTKAWMCDVARRHAESLTIVAIDAR
jgi:hypothetical protein